MMQNHLIWWIAEHWKGYEKGTDYNEVRTEYNEVSTEYNEVNTERKTQRI